MTKLQRRASIRIGKLRTRGRGEIEASTVTGKHDIADIAWPVASRGRM